MSSPENPTPHVPPVPRYGEYATPGQVPAPYTAEPTPPTPYYVPQNGPRPRRTWDLVLSVILLVIGFFAVLIAVANAFTLDMQMDMLYDDYGVDGSYSPGPATVIAQAVIILSHLVLYALAVIFTIVLLRKSKVAFWLPLTLGALAFVVFLVTFVVVIVGDPNLYQVLLEQSAP